MAASEATFSVERTIEKALPHLEEEGAWWIENKKCASCHHTTFLLWAKDLAIEAGYDVETELLKEQRNWMVNSFFDPVEPNENADEGAAKPGEVNGDRNVEGVAQFLISPTAEYATDEEREKLIKIVAANQKEDGNWKANGQLPRQQRPKLETTWASNQWAELALRDTPLHPEEMVITWKKGTSAKSTEWYAMNLIGYPNEKSVEQLLRRQQDDGGWAWIDGDPSGPIGTGMALFAMARTGIAKDHHERVKRAINFLTSTQAENGEWETISTKDRSESTRVSNFWGSAWAVIGILEAEKAMKEKS